MLNSMYTNNSVATHPPATSKRWASRRESALFQAPTLGMGVVSIILFLVILRLGVVLLPLKPPMSSLQSVGSSDNLGAGLITIYLITIGGFLATGALTIFLHEMTHGLVSLACGYWPRLERGKFEYVRAAYEGQLTRNQLIFISLAPLFILSLAILPLLLVPWLKFFAFIALAGNVAGSLDDVQLAYRVWQASHFASVSKASR